MAVREPGRSDPRPRQRRRSMRWRRSPTSTPGTPTMLEAVRADAQLGQKVQITGTPTFFINGIRIGVDPASRVHGSRHRTRAAAGAGRHPMTRWMPFEPRRLPSTITSDSGVRRPYVALDALTLQVRPGRGLRFPRAERRRQDHDAQAADAADLSDRLVAPRSSAGRSATSASGDASATCRRIRTSTTI